VLAHTVAWICQSRTGLSSRSAALFANELRTENP